MNKKAFFSIIVVIFLIAIPGVTFAVPNNLTDVVNIAVELVKNILWTIAVAFVIVMFVIAGFKFLTAQGDPQQVAEARKALIWGLVGATVIVLAWSVITIVSLQFGV